MLPKPKTLLLLSTQALVGQMLANPLIISMDFSPTLQSLFTAADDPLGIDGSTWSLKIVSNDTTYKTFNQFNPAGIETDSVTLTIIGSTELDGSYKIEDSATTDLAILPYASGLFVFRDKNQSSIDFEIGGFFGFWNNLDATSVLGSAPSVGAPVASSDFDNASEETGNNTMSFNMASYDTGPYTFTVVPEPANAAAIIGLLTIGFCSFKRRSR